MPRSIHTFPATLSGMRVISGGFVPYGKGETTGIFCHQSLKGNPG